jgi:hypothetical protein
LAAREGVEVLRRSGGIEPGTRERRAQGSGRTRTGVPSQQHFGERRPGPDAHHGTPHGLPNTSASCNRP